MNSATVPTGLQLNYDPRQPFTVNLNIALREFHHSRPDAEPTEIRLNPAVLKLNGVRVVLDSRVKPGKIQVNGLEAAE